MDEARLEIVAGDDPEQLVRFAAAELQGYVERLFGFRAEIRAHSGPARATVTLDAAAAGMDAPAADEEFLLRRFERAGRPALAALGGSPVATMWAVYDLVERWGVRYLLRGDVFPPAPNAFHLPDVDLVRRPNLRRRGVRLLNLFPMGLESWSLADIQGYLDQLAKLKFNSVYHQLWCWQPFVHYQCRGVSKSTGTHWFGWHYPIDEHTIGRHHFGGLGEFVPPDFEACRTYRERVEAGQRLVRGSFAHARARGMETQICTVITDFPPEFRRVLDGPPLAPHGFGATVSGGHLGADHPGFQDLCGTALRAYIDTYPEVDSLIVGMPEFHASDMPFEAAWERLDGKYGFEEVRALEQVLEQASGRADYPGGSARIQAAVKGDIVALDLFDRLLNEQRVLQDCARPDAEILFTGVSEELAEVLNLMRPGALFPCALDYTSSRMARRPEAFERLRRAGLRPSLTMTTQDDNVGVAPQLSTASIHQLLEYLRRYDWEGFQLRYWMISDMEPTVAYLGAATWDEEVTVAAAYGEHAQTLCGDLAAGELVACFDILDQVTIGLGDHGLGVGFPVPQMGMSHWLAGGEFSSELAEDRRQWRRALEHVRRAREQASRGHEYLDYLSGRLEFGIGYLDLIETLKKAGQANKDGDRGAALAHLEAAVDVARRAVGTHARIARSTDRGTLAQLNEDLYRTLSRLLEAVRADQSWTRPSGGTAGGALVE